MEPMIGDTWLFERLTSDPVLAAAGVFADLAPRDREPPYVVFSLLSATDVNGLGARRIMANALYTVRAVAVGESYPDDLARRIDAALHGQRGTAADGQVLGCVREQALRYTALNDGIQERHLGGIYRLFIQHT